MNSKAESEQVFWCPLKPEAVPHKSWLPVMGILRSLCPHLDSMCPLSISRVNRFKMESRFHTNIVKAKQCYLGTLI